jgi:hypothetical protein
MIHLDKLGSESAPPPPAMLDWHDSHGPTGEEIIAQASAWVIRRTRVQPCKGWRNRECADF